MRHALVDAGDNVVNVIELEPGHNYTPAEGLTLVEGRDWPAPVPPSAPPLEYIKAAARRTIDSAAEAERLKYITGGSGQALVYEAKRTEVARRRANAELTLDAANFPWAASRAENFNTTIADVLVTWGVQADAWADIGRAIENVREGAKAAIDAAEDEAAVNAVVANLVWPTP